MPKDSLEHGAGEEIPQHPHPGNTSRDAYRESLDKVPGSKTGPKVLTVVADGAMEVSKIIDMGVGSVQEISGWNGIALSVSLDDPR